MPSAAPQPLRHRVHRSGDGKTLLSYLCELLPLADNEIRSAIEQDRFCLEDGAILTAKSLLSAGQIVLADVPERSPTDPFLPAPEGPLVELYRDDHILAVCKPPGLLCHPMGTTRLSAMSLVQQELQREGARTELRPLHRLDRETSGVLLMARSRAADVATKALFERRQVHKRYLALVHGHLSETAQMIDAPIARDDGPIRVRMRVHGSGKSAQTTVRALQHFGAGVGGGDGYSWVEAHPRTGRTHQIRVHLAHLGHPIVGDKLYCGDGDVFLKKWRGELQDEDIEQLGLPRHALHASELRLDHPINGESLRIQAATPGDMLAFARDHSVAYRTTQNQ